MHKEATTQRIHRSYRDRLSIGSAVPEKKHFFGVFLICLRISGFTFTEIKTSMLQGGYKIRNQAAIHFLTFAVVEWVDVFTQKGYRDIVLDSIRFCQAEKGLLLHCWCIMSNHVHLIASAKRENLSDVLGDFKKFTSKKVIEAIKQNKSESRRDCLPAGRQGWSGYLKSRVRRTAGIPIGNSGGKITIRRNYTVPLLLSRK